MKATNLMRMQQAGLPVPAFRVVEEEEKIEEIDLSFSEAAYFAVRSSYSEEDGESRSYAGQFTSLLSVPRTEVETAVQKVRESITAAAVQAYREQLEQQSVTGGRLRVIIQEMIEAEFSGVIFTANPKGLLSETVVVAAPGLGEGVVSDAVDTVTVHIHRSEGSSYRVLSGEAISLPESLVDRAMELGRQVETLFGRPMDIEYAYRDGHIYLLQARPISSLAGHTQQVILDDSNIAESYPGLSSPLTASFAKQIYSGVFRSLLVRLIGEKAVNRQYTQLLTHMVESCNGRMYYRITNWYEVLHLLPLSSKIIPLWQEMLGVETKTVSFALGRVPLRRKLRVVVAFVRLLSTVRRNMRRLHTDFTALLPDYEDRIAAEQDPRNLWLLYRELLERLIADWDWTLINDMYAFLFTGLSGKHRAQISQMKELESMKPVRAMDQLVETAMRYGIDSERYRRAEAAYISQYGDRCVGELKLETKTYRSHPSLLREQVEAQLRGQREAATEESPEAVGRLPAQKEKRLPLFARLAQKGIEGREQSRLNRSRTFGIMRTIIRKIADSSKVSLGEDIFYLTLEQIEAVIFEGRDMREQIEIAKLRQENFAKAAAVNRLVFCTEPFEIADRIAQEDEAQAATAESNLLQGTAVSEGIVRGKVLLVTDPQAVDPMQAQGRILVTHSTDPGWFMLVHRCAALIAERGSLLSHTAIIARELKKPAIVGVRQALQRLEDGAYVEVDANRGLIRRLQKEEETV